jgi:small-conductance mechanosensitive channel
MSDWGTLLRHASERIVDQFAIIVPRLTLSLLLVVLGVIVAWLAQMLVRGILSRAGLDRLASHTGIGGTLTRLGVEHPASHLAGFVAFWAVLAVFLLTGADVLGLPAVSQAIANLIALMPNLALVVLLLLLGFTLARTARRAIEGVADRSRMVSARTLGRGAYYLVAVVTAVIALSGVGLDFTIVTAALAVVLASLGAGLAVTVALGARRVAQNTISGVYARRDVRVGDRIRLADGEGDVTAVGQIFLTLRHGGRTRLVPYERLLEEGVEIVSRAGGAPEENS